MRLIPRYIFTECLIFFGISLAAFTGVLLTIRMLQFASLIINKGVEPGQIGMVFLAIVPTFLEIALPLAVLLGVMLCFARLSGDSEIIILRASGISILQLVRPLLIFGGLLGIISLGVSLWLRPWGFRQLSVSLFEIARSRTTAGLSEGIFNKLGRLTLYAEHINFATGDLEHVLIDDRRSEESRQIISAKSGRISSNPSDQSIMFDLRDGEIHEQPPGGKYSITAYRTNRVLLKPEDVYGTEANRDRRSQELSVPEIREIIDQLSTQFNSAKAGDETEVITVPQSTEILLIREIPRKIRRLQLEIGRRYSMPYAAFILAIIGLPLGIQPPRSQRTWGIGLSALLGLIVFVLYYALLSIGITLAESNVVAPWFGLWLPNIFMTIVTTSFVYQMGTERWHSIAHAAELFLQRTYQRIRPAPAPQLSSVSNEKS